MDRRIEAILQDLFTLDPTLRGQEEAMRKTIGKLSAERPDTRFDTAFEKELKEKLLHEFAARRPAAPPLRLWRRRWVWGAAAAVVVAAVALPFFLHQARPWQDKTNAAAPAGRVSLQAPSAVPPRDDSDRDGAAAGAFNTENYAAVHENDFLPAMQNPLSTFSIDVDTASYANVRRFLGENTLPPRDAVRLEELINYFSYDYPLPTGDEAFAVHTEVGPCPWNSAHQLVSIGLQGRDIPAAQLPPSNLVFLLDVSGSMDEPNKLPLLQQSLRLLVRELSPRDRVAVVVYAGAAGLVLPSTPGDRRETILAAIDRLQAGGSTAGGEGLRLAYRIAAEGFIPHGNNRIILASDGDFNIGPSSDAEMERLVEEERKKGIFLTVLGFGMGNYKDSRMEILADKGNGNYAYIDSLLEAKKVLVNDIRKTLFTIAGDVKIQVEFNPALVRRYRLLGYENRLLKKEDFADDTKDAGEIGSGHTVTALYEIETGPAATPPDQELKYQTSAVRPQAAAGRELLTLHVRYKPPRAERSVLLSRVVERPADDRGEPSVNFRFASAVAEFGLLLCDSRYKGRASFESVLQRAEAARGSDREGYRGEFLQLVRKAEALTVAARI